MPALFLDDRNISVDICAKSFFESNLIYKELNIGSAVTFKERLHIHKSDINTGKKRCGEAKYFLECYTSEGKFDNLKNQLVESVNVPDNPAVSHGLNFLSDWYCLNRKGYRK